MPAALGVDAPRKRPAIEALGVRLADFPQRVCVVGEPDDLTRLGRAAIRRERAKPPVKARRSERRFVMLETPVPRLREVGGAWIALPRIADGGGEIFKQRASAEPRRDRRPCPRRAGNGDGRPAVLRHAAVFGPAVCDHTCRIREHGGGAAGVEPVKPPVPLAPDEREGVRPDAVCRRLRDRERSRRGDRGVHGVAALPERLQTGGSRLRGGAVHHTAARVHRKPLRAVALQQGVECGFHVSIASLTESYHSVAQESTKECLTSHAFIHNMMFITNESIA